MGAIRNSIRFGTVLALHAGLLLSSAATGHTAARSETIETGVVESAGGAVNVRSGPASDRDDVGTLADGESPSIHCKVRGEHVSGDVRDSSTWLRVGKDRWISHAYIRWTDGSPDLPWCAMDSQRPTRAEAVTGGTDLNIRGEADSGAELVGTLKEGTAITVQCQVWGQSVDGAVDETDIWYRIAEGENISAAYVKWSNGLPWLPWCGQDPPSVPSGGQQGFIDLHAPAAQDSRRDTGVPASVTLAQAILETGWGDGALAREDHNLFGMKCFGSPGDHAIGCRDYATFECSPTGGCFDMDATFRAYDNVADSFLDHGDLLSGWDRYATAMEHADDPDRFAREIHKAGYATDPEYADKLIGLMEQFDLYAYDA